MHAARFFALIAAAGVSTLTAVPVAADPTAHVFERPINTQRNAQMNRAAAFGGGAFGGGTAMANSVVISQQGRGHTLILNINQNNSGNIVAGANLNGRLNLD